MTIMPLYDRVVVKRIEVAEVSEGGIIVPETSRAKPTEGVVVAVGPGRVLDNGQKNVPTVDVGDRVLFGKYAGLEVKIGSEDLVFLREEDILAILRG